jgi:hypothetical protein
VNPPGQEHQAGKKIGDHQHGQPRHSERQAQRNGNGSVR